MAAVSSGRVVNAVGLLIFGFGVVNGDNIVNEATTNLEAAIVVSNGHAVFPPHVAPT
jgi:hypothetical protein